MKLKPFRIEAYYARHEFTAQYMLSSSDCESRTVQEVLSLEPGSQDRMLRLWCGYTESPGAPYLREAISGIYQCTAPDDVLVMAAAEEGIFVAYHALLGPNDHVVVETPCYESALEVARSTGASVSTWQRRFEDGWAHDLDALRGLIQPNTKLLYINTPSNPTGTQMPRAVFDQIVELAQEHGFYVFCDEVYRELEHDPTQRLPAISDVLERGIGLGSVSKTYGLPGLRLGWLVTRDPTVIERCVQFKHYTTICSSAPSEFLASIALRNRQVLVDRNLGIVQRNLPLLQAFFARRADLFEWVPPTASPIGFPRMKHVPDTQDFCEEIVRETSVLLLPGSVYDEPQHIRFGFGRTNMPEALERLDAYLTTKFGS